MKTLKVTMTREELRNHSTLGLVCFEFADVTNRFFVQSSYEWRMCRNAAILTIFFQYIVVQEGVNHPVKCYHKCVHWFTRAKFIRLAE